MVGVELLQGGVEMSPGRFPENEWEGLPLLQVLAGFGGVVVLHLSVRDESENEPCWPLRVDMAGVLYLWAFFLPFLLLLLFAPAHLLQRGRRERSQELRSNRGQQRGEPATLQGGADRALVLQPLSVAQENTNNT